MQELISFMNTLNVGFTAYEPENNFNPIKFKDRTRCTVAELAKKIRGLAAAEDIEVPSILRPLIKNPELLKKTLDKMAEEMAERLAEQKRQERENRKREKELEKARDLQLKKELKEQQAIELTPEYRHVQLYCDPTNHGDDNFYLVDTRDNTISDKDPRNYILQMGWKPREAVINAIGASKAYEPTKGPGLIRPVSEGECGIFNTYRRPAWQTCDMYELITPKVPTLIDKLVKHVIPLEIEREFFYSWLFTALTSRAPTYLIFCGKGGTGKTTLKEVCFEFMGPHNSDAGKHSLTGAQFNSQLEGKTLLWFDELKYGAKEENTLKEWQNKRMGMEKKFQDTVQLNMTASMIISNNETHDNYIRMTGRKFVPLQVNTERLETSMTFQEIEELKEIITDPKYMCQFGKWILQNGKDPRWPILEYRGPDFYRLAAKTSHSWAKAVAHKLLYPPPLGRGGIVKDYRVPGKGIQWSLLAEVLKKDKGFSRLALNADYTKVFSALTEFCTSKGEPLFEVELVSDDVEKNPLGDFYITVKRTPEKEIAEAMKVDPPKTKQKVVTEEPPIKDEDLL